MGPAGGMDMADQALKSLTAHLRRRPSATTPFEQPADGRRLGVDNRTYNKLLRSLRCQGERGFGLLVGRWRVLRHVTASPNRIGDLANAALVLTQFEHRYVNG
jgi:DDE superfamily endonuclease